jgi:methionyl-tRNA formyltransferase
MNIAVLASGGLGLSCLQKLPASVNVICILTDSKSEGIIEHAQKNNIPLFRGNPRTGKAVKFLRAFEVDVILSINYLFVIGKELIDCASKYAFNIHGSLLPKYRGRTPHVWSIINNEPKTGLTIHLIDEGCDTGDVVLQKTFDITSDMTGTDVLKRFEELYPSAINEALEAAAAGRIQSQPQDHTKATYFGKRTPEDGLINWHWQKERICNWVRAQARPYPGAFSFYKGNKITIHKIEMNDYGFHYEEEDGKILDVVNGKPIIKTPNGAISLVDFELNSPEELTKGEILHA